MCKTRYTNDSESNNNKSDMMRHQTTNQREASEKTR